MLRRAPVALLLTMLVTPYAAHAAFFFSEVMYDAAGTDAKHEWVEVLNDGSAVDLSTYKFFENGSNHGLTLFAGSATVAAGQYAIIADDATTFLADYPSFSGTLFDAAFSLSNTGESVALRDGALVDVASATYTADAGAAGDGNSLNYSGGAWVPRSPSPGAATSGGQAPQTETATTESTTVSSGGGGSATAEEPPKITVDAGADRTVVVGAGAVFSATAYGIKGEPLSSARYIWNFGNGASKEGKTILFAYSIPGTYVVTVDASNAGFSSSDRLAVHAVAAEVVVTRANTSLIELENRSSYELDIGLWQLMVGQSVFVLPAHTILLAKKTIALSADTTGLMPEGPTDVSLYYPNGAKAGGAAPEYELVSAPVVEPASAPAHQVLQAYVAPAVKAAPPAEAREVPATTSVSDVRQLTASAGQVSDTWAWVSVFLLALMVAAGVAGVLYLQRKP